MSGTKKQATPLTEEQLSQKEAELQAKDEKLNEDIKSFEDFQENVFAAKEKLEEEFSLPVTLWDERLTTMAAERVLIEADVRRKNRKKVIDKMAAVMILQGYLDRKSF